MCSSDLEFPFFSQPFVSLRTLRDTSALGSEMSSETWAAEVTRRRGEYSARLKSALRTNENGSSSWPTVGANEDSYRIGGNSQASKSLSGMARRGELSWPTASSRDHKGAPQSRLTPEGYNARLDEAVVIYGQVAQANPSTDGSRPELSDKFSWATPKASDPQHSGPNMRDSAGNYALPAQAVRASWATPRAGKVTDENPETWAIRNDRKEVATMPLTAQVKTWPTPAASTGNGGPHGLDGGAGARSMLPQEMKNSSGKLNPRWVETLMGLPVGWVMPSCASPVTIELMNCEPSAMELFPQPPQSPSQR